MNPRDAGSIDLVLDLGQALVVERPEQIEGGADAHIIRRDGALPDGRTAWDGVEVMVSRATRAKTRPPARTAPTDRERPGT